MGSRGKHQIDLILHHYHHLNHKHLQYHRHLYRFDQDLDELGSCLQNLTTHRHQYQTAWEYQGVAPLEKVRILLLEAIV